MILTLKILVTCLVAAIVLWAIYDALSVTDEAGNRDELD